MRYVLFLGKHWIGTRAKKDHDSYAYDDEYMVRDPDHFLCLSYHLPEENNETDDLRKDIMIQIK